MRKFGIFILLSPPVSDISLEESRSWTALRFPGDLVLPVVTGQLTAGVVDDHLLLQVHIGPVQPLVLLELLHGLTERNGVRTPGVPGRSTPHHPGLAGLHALQEVVVLLLLAGLLRPVEEVVLGDGDVEKGEISCPPVLIIQPDPRKGEAVDENQIELGVMEEDFVGYVGLQKESAAISIGVDFLRVSEGVTHPIVDGGHLAPPQGGVHLVLLD